MSLEVDPTKSSNPTDKKPEVKQKTSEKKPAEDIHTTAKKEQEKKTVGTKTASQTPDKTSQNSQKAEQPNTAKQDNKQVKPNSIMTQKEQKPAAQVNQQQQPVVIEEKPSKRHTGLYYRKINGKEYYDSYRRLQTRALSLSGFKLKSENFFTNDETYTLVQDNHTAKVKLDYDDDYLYVKEELYDLTAEHQELEVVQGAKLGKAIDKTCDDEGTLVETFKNGATRETSSDGKTITTTYADGSTKIEYKNKSGWYDINYAEVYLDNKKMTVMYDAEGNTIYREVK